MLHLVNRPDVVYLRRLRGRWQVVKPGLVYGNSSVDGPPGCYDALWPPADAAAVNRTASIVRPRHLCPAGGSAVAGGARTLEGEGSGDRPVPIADAPWLNLRAARFVRLGSGAMCAELDLAGRPRVDTAYGIDISQDTPGGGQTVDAFDLIIDGAGGLHADLRDPPRGRAGGEPSCPTSYGLVGDRLTFFISPAPNVFSALRPLYVDASSDSLQTGEPLLGHPLDAGDTVPGLFGLRLGRASARRSGRCG